MAIAAITAAWVILLLWLRDVSIAKAKERERCSDRPPTS